MGSLVKPKVMWSSLDLAAAGEQQRDDHGHEADRPVQRDERRVVDKQFDRNERRNADDEWESHACGEGPEGPGDAGQRGLAVGAPPRAVCLVEPYKGSALGFHSQDLCL